MLYIFFRARTNVPKFQASCRPIQSKCPMHIIYQVCSCPHPPSRSIPQYKSVSTYWHVRPSIGQWFWMKRNRFLFAECTPFLSNTAGINSLLSNLKLTPWQHVFQHTPLSSRLVIGLYWLPVCLLSEHFVGVSSNHHRCKVSDPSNTFPKQRVKVGHSRSEWRSVAQGVPQGSILGPLTFYIFINDIFYALENVGDLYNHADDDNLLNIHHYITCLKTKLETSAVVAMHWFDVNGMKSNQAKFQAMILNHHPDLSDISLCVNDMSIPLKSLWNYWVFS